MASSDAVGKMNVGPTPHSNAVFDVADRMAVKPMSPKPETLFHPSGVRFGETKKGMDGSVIRFHSVVSGSGSVGRRSKTYCPRI
jgi:hypothetical protein